MGKHRFKLFLSISFSIHLGIILFVGNLDFNPIKDKDHILRVEITPLPPKAPSPPLPPKPKITGRRAPEPKKSKIFHGKPRNLSQVGNHGQSSPPDREDTIVLNTKNPKYLSYSSRIKRKIDLEWKYPDDARKEATQGKLNVMFSIVRTGDLAGLQLLESSGSEVLDDGAMNAVRRAAPYDPIPRRMEIDKLNIMATFEYRLNHSQ